MLLILVAAALQARSGLNHDVAWYLYVARSVADGLPYYVDRPGSFLDVNPPLVVWTLLPPLWLVRALALPITAAPTVLIALETLAGVGLTRAILQRAKLSLTLAWGAAGAGLLLVGPDFAQREHQAVLLLFPALVELTVIKDAPSLPRWLRLSVGISAGLGAALKPHFVISWVVIEMIFAAVDRRPKQLVRMELLVAGGVLVAYAASIFAITPGYLSLAREWGPLYLAWLKTPARVLVLQPECVVSVAVAMLAMLTRRQGVPGRTAFVFAISGLAFAAAAIAQGKGFSYHWYPSVAFAAISVGASLRAVEQAPARAAGMVTATIAIVVLLTAWARIASGFTLASDRRRLQAAIAVAAAVDGGHGRQPTDGMVILSTRLVDAFPMVTNLDLPWPMRWPSLWVLEAAAPVACIAPPSGIDRRSEQRVRDDLWEDLVRARPQAIVVQPIPRSMRRRAGCRTLADHLAREPRFAAFFEQYPPTGTIVNGTDAPFTVLTRRSEQHVLPFAAPLVPPGVASGAEAATR